MLLKELVSLLELAPSDDSNDDDKHKKIRALIDEQILKTVSLDNKQMMELRDALEHTGDDGLSEIVDIIEAITEWYAEDPDSVKIWPNWYENDYNISDLYYQTVSTVYDHAWSRVYDKKKAILRAEGTPHRGPPNDLFPYTEQIDHYVDDVSVFAKHLYDTFPVFAVAAKKGIENMKKALQQKRKKR